MSADLFEDSFPHGTVAGYQQGCKGGACPAHEEYGLSCRTAKSLAAGDYQYRKLIARGKTVAEISAELGLVGTLTLAAPAAPKKKPAPLPVEPVPTVAPEPEKEVVPVATKNKTEPTPRYVSSRGWCDGCEEYDAQSEATLATKATTVSELATATVTPTADDTADWSLGLTADDLRNLAQQLDHLGGIDVSVIGIRELPVLAPGQGVPVGRVHLDPGFPPRFFAA